MSRSACQSGAVQVEIKFQQHLAMAPMQHHANNFHTCARDSILAQLVPASCEWYFCLFNCLFLVLVTHRKSMLILGAMWGLLRQFVIQARVAGLAIQLQQPWQRGKQSVKNLWKSCRSGIFKHDDNAQCIWDSM